MTTRAGRRTDALTRERIVAAAVEILDAGGEDALTFRALTTHLDTGPGAVYHHVGGRDELLSAATGVVVAAAVAPIAATGEPADAVRAVALAVHDVIDAHPWVGPHLARAPWQSAMLPVLERIGAALREFGLSRRELFDSTTALLNLVLGLAGQHAAAARLVPPGTDRAAFLATVAGDWDALDPDRYPVTHDLAGALRDHDDRAQFLAGVDLVLAGVAALAAGRSRPRGR